MNPKEYAQLLYETLSPFGRSPAGGKDKTDDQQGKILERFKALLAKNKDTHLATAVGKEFEKIQEQKARENVTYIASSSKLSQSQKQELENIFPDPREFSENPYLLGGVAVRQKDKIYNSTLRKKIESLKFSL